MRLLFIDKTYRASRNFPKIKHCIELLSRMEQGDSLLSTLLTDLSLYCIQEQDISIALELGIANELARFPMSDKIFFFLINFLIKKKHRLQIILHPSDYLSKFRYCFNSDPTIEHIVGFRYLSLSSEAHSIMLTKSYVDYILKMKGDGFKIFYNIVGPETYQRMDNLTEIYDGALALIDECFLEVVEYLGVLFECMEDDDYESENIDVFLDIIAKKLCNELPPNDYCSGVRCLRALICLELFPEEDIIRISNCLIDGLCLNKNEYSVADFCILASTLSEYCNFSLENIDNIVQNVLKNVTQTSLLDLAFSEMSTVANNCLSKEASEIVDQISRKSKKLKLDLARKGFDVHP